jgi:dsRNA-specific ribonuclease
MLNYQFKDKFLLLEAFTHKSFKESFTLTAQYEKLEVLGDSILDYLANSNLIKYTILEKYNLEERMK